MEILNQFGINPLLLAAQVVNFLILLFILKKFMFKPILKVLDERKERIASSLKNAEEIEKRLLETDEKIDKMMVKATSDIQKMMDESRKEAAELKEELVATAQKNAEEIIQKGQETVKSEGEKMRQEIMVNVAQIVAKGMEKVTGKVLTKKDQMQLIEKEIKNLS